jgi:hypothetical protein
MVDALCLEDLDLYGREWNSPLDELYQDLLHRAQEDPGENIDDADRGVGLRRILSRGYDTTRVDSNGQPIALQSIARTIESDYRKDPRVQQVAASLVLASDGSITINVQVVANEGELGISLVWFGNTLVTKSNPPGPS